MKRKSLMAIGVAGAFAAASAYAVTPHPISVDDASSPWASHMHRQSTMLTPNHVGSSDHFVGSTSASAGGTLSGGSTFDHSFSTSSSSMSSETGLTMDQSMTLADQGVYSEYYQVSAMPVESWDYYALTPVFDLSSESVVYVPTYLGSEYTFIGVESAM